MKTIAEMQSEIIVRRKRIYNLQAAISNNSSQQVLDVQIRIITGMSEIVGRLEQLIKEENNNA